MAKEKKHVHLPVVRAPQNVFDVWGGKVLDPLGSYTGRPEDPFEQPVQDADDL